MGPIVRSTLAEQAYLDLRQQIMSGRLPAGRRLVPEELAAALAISATPIKAALVRLDQDGLVAMETRRGAVVRRFTTIDVRNLFEARQVIELHAMARGCDEGSIDAAFNDRLQAVQDSLLAQRALGSEAGLIEALDLDRAFHRQIVALAGNQTLADWHERVMMHTHTVEVYSLATYPLQPLATEHAAIIAACRKADAATACATLKTHLLLSRDDILSRLPDQPGT